jgi:hypothetical protein
MVAYGCDSDDSTPRSKWQELQIKVLGERLAEKDRFREMDQHVWEREDKEQRSSAKEADPGRSIEPDRDR